MLPSLSSPFSFQKCTDPEKKKSIVEGEVKVGVGRVCGFRVRPTYVILEFIRVTLRSR